MLNKLKRTAKALASTLFVAAVFFVATALLIMGIELLTGFKSLWLDVGIAIALLGVWIFTTENDKVDKTQTKT